MNLIEKIKDFRVRLDRLKQLTNGLDKSDEITYCSGNLLLAKAHLGSLLGEIGTDNPYSDNKKTVEDIEPTADVNTTGSLEDVILKGRNKDILWEKVSHIEKVDWIRQE